MKKILLSLLLVMSMGVLATTPSTSPEIVFEKGNFFPITQQFNNRLLNNFSDKVLRFEGEEMVIYFDTPGGSVIALSKMARIMKSSKIKFTCVASFAASAGFMLFQHCQNRYLLSDGVLMSHNWAGGFSGEAPRILSLFYTIQGLVDTLEAVAIEKMSVDAKEYAALINNNLWMTSELAYKYAAIDEVNDNVSCSRELLNQKIQIGSYRNYSIYKSGCPLIQKVYKKSARNNNDGYLDSGLTLFDLAQSEYKMGQANWIYQGNKSFE